jgi:regulatory protein
MAVPQRMHWDQRQPEPGEEAEPCAAAGPIAGRVTAIEPQVRDPERVNVFVEGKFAFGLARAVLVDAGLRAGDVVTAEQVADLLKREAVQVALQQAYAYLSYRPRSEQELRRSLTQKGHAPETVDAVIARLRDLHYVDDEVFALSWVENRQRFRPRGAHLLRAELRQKGIAREAADQAIADAGADERALVLDVAQKKQTTIKAADYQEFARKLAGHLLRRGFSSDVVWDTVRTVWAARTGELPDPVE